MTRCCVATVVMSILLYSSAFSPHRHYASTKRVEPLNAWFSNFLKTSAEAAAPMTTGEEDVDVIVVGAGIAGLSCSKAFLDAGMKSFKVLEASDKPGGRIQTDELNGYLLDRGFQVFIESYPEAQKAFNYNELELQQFLPGAFVRLDGAFHLVSDPIRRPVDLLPTLISPVGSILDKIRIGIYSILIRFVSLESIYKQKETTTAEYLFDKQGLSSNMIDSFFSPFYQGTYTVYTLIPFVSRHTPSPPSPTYSLT